MNPPVYKTASNVLKSLLWKCNGWDKTVNRTIVWMSVLTVKGKLMLLQESPMEMKAIKISSEPHMTSVIIFTVLYMKCVSHRLGYPLEGTITQEKQQRPAGHTRRCLIDGNFGILFNMTSEWDVQIFAMASGVSSVNMARLLKMYLMYLTCYNHSFAVGFV